MLDENFDFSRKKIFEVFNTLRIIKIIFKNAVSGS